MAGLNAAMFLAFCGCAFFRVPPRIFGVGHMAGEERDEVPTSPQDARLSSLDERLRQAERAEGERKPAVGSGFVVRSAGSQLAQNLVGMPLGGFIVGFLLDKLFGTLPWIALALMFIGFAGGVLELMKSAKQGADEGAGK